MPFHWAYLMDDSLRLEFAAMVLETSELVTTPRRLVQAITEHLGSFGDADETKQTPLGDIADVVLETMDFNNEKLIIGG